MVAEIISVGTELLLGNIVNTNAKYLAVKCAEAGLSMYYQSVVGDNEQRLSEALKTSLSRSDVIILTGGLGPTKDDLTKEVVAKVTNRNLVRDEKIKATIEEYMSRRGSKVIPESNWKQADVIEGAIVLENANGTAPGLIVEMEENKCIVLLPGPPGEMEPMFQNSVLEYFKSKQPQTLVSVMIKIAGIGESAAEEMVSDLIENQSNPTIAPYAKLSEVHFRITASAETEEEATQLIKPVVKEFKKRFGENIYSLKEEENLEDVIVKLLKKHDLTISTAESCTGGLLTSRLVNVAGVSEVLKQGFITYTNKSKRKYLDVNKQTLKKYGAVSEETVKEMVKGAAIGTDSDTAIAISGIAGPEGGTEEKPIGTVYIGCYANEKCKIKRFNFIGNRNKIRESSVNASLDMLRRLILSQYEK